MSPVSEYFGGHGDEIMSDMKKRYGKRARSIFYATANKKKGALKKLIDKRRSD